MKKICVFLCNIFLLIGASFMSSSFYENTCYSKVEISTYAKVLDNCILYRSTNLEEDIDNIYFVIPETYFVKIIETINEECIKVQYGNYVGYINPNYAIIATFSPNLKTLEGITCDIKETSGTQIWSKPSASSSVLTTIQAGTKKIKYIATAYGLIPTGGQSNIWYYVSYTSESNSTNVYEGYVYSENVINLSKIVLNSEKNPEPENKINDKYSLTISSPIKALVISIIAIPIIILFLIIIYRIMKIIKSKSSKNNMENNKINSNSYNSFNPNYNFENGGYNQNELTNENINQNNLKQEITDMSGKQFIRKIHNQKNYRVKDYPIFPSYDSDDDLL